MWIILSVDHICVVNLFHATAVSIGWMMRKVTSIGLHSNFPVPYRVKFELEIRNDHYSATEHLVDRSHPGLLYSTTSSSS
ncbi:putative serine/threonine-protein kinase [Trichinella spiralis]|uniref:Serine/threonine-protein kinase n=1 Tax=Trichinella spiralis TaxID=6334 RepID=A0ABR3KUS9_TRISP